MATNMFPSNFEFVFLPRFGSEVDRFRVAGRLTTFHFMRKLTVIIGSYKSTKNNELP